MLAFLHALALSLLLALQSCAPITPVEGQDRDSPGPYPVHYKEMVKGYLARVLRDPGSVRDLSISPPLPTRFWVGIQRGGNVQAYVLCVAFNAKNAYGGYVGHSSYLMAIKDGQFVLDAVGNIVFGEGRCDRPTADARFGPGEQARGAAAKEPPLA